MNQCQTCGGDCDTDEEFCEDCAQISAPAPAPAPQTDNDEAEAAEAAWIAEYLQGLGTNPDGRYIMGCTNPRYNLQDEMESDMVEASIQYENEHGTPFPSIDGDYHYDVGVLADLIEEFTDLSSNSHSSLSTRSVSVRFPYCTVLIGLRPTAAGRGC
eukprot:SAG31_NODE_1465_length_8232_cov_31.250830_5_plen_157_part_00